MNGQKYNFKGCKERISVITSHARGSEHFDEKLLFPFYFLNFFTVLMSEKTGCPGAWFRPESTLENQQQFFSQQTRYSGDKRNSSLPLVSLNIFNYQQASFTVDLTSPTNLVSGLSGQYTILVISGGGGTGSSHIGEMFFFNLVFKEQYHERDIKLVSAFFQSVFTSFFWLRQVNVEICEL